MRSRSSSSSLSTSLTSPQDDKLPQLSYEQTNLLRTLREQLRELRPPLASKFDAILILFQTLKNDEPVMATLLRYYRRHPDVIRLSDQLSTFVEHFGDALKSANVHYRIDPGSLQFEHLQTCFDGLGVCVPNKRGALLSKPPGTNCHASLQRVTDLLLTQATGQGLPDAMDTNDQVFGILNAVSRLMKAGVIHCSDAVTHVFAEAMPLFHDWLGGNQQQQVLTTHNLGRCAVQIDTALKLVRRNWQTPLDSRPDTPKGPATWGQLLQSCVLKLCAEPVLRRLAGTTGTTGTPGTPGDTVALLNVCNTVKTALEQRLLSLTDPALQPALGRLIDTIGRVPADPLMGRANDGRPLANFSNFLRTLGELQALQSVQTAPLPGLASACASLVQAINDEAFHDLHPDPQVLTNLVSFIKFCDKHASTQSSSSATSSTATTTNTSTTSTTSTTTASTTTASSSRTDRITPVLSTPLLQQATEQVMMFLLETTADELREPETIGGLLSGLDYLWRRKLVAPSPQIKALAVTLLQQLGQHKAATWNDQRKATLLPALLGMVNSGMVNEQALQPALAVLLPGARSGQMISVSDLQRESIRLGGIEETIIALPPLPASSSTSTTATASTATTSAATTGNRPIPGDTPIRPTLLSSPLVSTTPPAANKSSMPLKAVRRERDDEQVWETPTKTAKPLSDEDIAIATEPTVVIRAPATKKGSPPKPDPTTANNAGNTTSQRASTKSGNAGQSVANTNGPATSQKSTQNTKPAKLAKPSKSAKPAKPAKPARTLEAAIISGQAGQLDALLPKQGKWSAAKVADTIEEVRIEITNPNQDQIAALNRFLDLVLPKLDQADRLQLSVLLAPLKPTEQAFREVLHTRGMMADKAVQQTTSTLHSVDLSKSLNKACISGNIDKVRQLLAQDPKGMLTLKQDEKGLNALMCAAHNGQAAIVELLLTQTNGAKQAVQQDKEGATALMYAAQAGQMAVVELLLKLDNGNAQAIQHNNEGVNALILAVRFGHTAIVKRLLSLDNGHKQALQKTEAGETALIFAALDGHKEIVELLLNHESGNTQSIQKAKNGETALMVAAAKGQAPVVELLLKLSTANKQAIQQYKDGNIALTIAAYNGHAPVIKRLLKLRNADEQVIYKNVFGANALISAAGQGHKDVVELLLEHATGNAHVLQQTMDGDTALIAAVQDGHTPVVKLLLKHETRNEQAVLQNVRGTTALMIAVNDVNLEILELLLELSNVDEQVIQKDEQGVNALMFAASLGQTTIVKRLLRLDNGKEQAAQKAKNGATALIVAAQAGHKEVVDCLLGLPNGDAQAIQQTNRGGNAMMNAAAFGHLAVVESLLRFTNANEQVAQQNKAGETAQMIAEGKGYTDIAAKIGALKSKIEKQ